MLDVEYVCRTGQATDDNMAHAHCMMDTNGHRERHSEYVIITAFPLQQWLQERASMIRYTFIAYLVRSLNKSVHSATLPLRCEI